MTLLTSPTLRLPLLLPLSQLSHLVPLLLRDVAVEQATVGHVGAQGPHRGHAKDAAGLGAGLDCVRVLEKKRGERE